MELESTSSGINVSINNNHKLKKVWPYCFVSFCFDLLFCCCVLLLVCSVLILPTPRNLKFKREIIDYFRLLPLIPLNGKKTILHFNQTRSSSFLICGFAFPARRPVDNAISPEPSKRKPLTKNCVFSTAFGVPSFWLKISRSNLNKSPYYCEWYILLSYNIVACAICRQQK